MVEHARRGIICFAALLSLSCKHPRNALTHDAQAPSGPTISNDETALRSVVRRWNDALNAADTKTLQSLYAPTVSYYGATLDPPACAAKVASFLAKRPHFHQDITITALTVSGDAAHVEFGKVTSLGPKAYSCYLVLARTGGDWKISEESDRDTDAALARAKERLAHPPAAPVVREEQHLVIDGVTETWRLVWTAPPDRMCFDDPRCVCWDFKYGEIGDLVLERERPGHAKEELDLGKLNDEGTVVVQHWVYTPTWEKDGGPPDPELDASAADAELSNLPVAHIMTFDDYDHDGRKTEFVFKLQGLWCGNPIYAVVVGISRSRPSLHVFAQADHPTWSIRLNSPDAWAQLRDAKAGHPVTFIDLACGNHGNETEQSTTVTWDADGFRVKAQSRDCGSHQ